MWYTLQQTEELPAGGKNIPRKSKGPPFKPLSDFFGLWHEYRRGGFYGSLHFNGFRGSFERGNARKGKWMVFVGLASFSGSIRTTYIPVCILVHAYVRAYVHLKYIPTYLHAYIYTYMPRTSSRLVRAMVACHPVPPVVPLAYCIIRSIQNVNNGENEQNKTKQVPKLAPQKNPGFGLPTHRPSPLLGACYSLTQTWSPLYFVRPASVTSFRGTLWDAHVQIRGGLTRDAHQRGEGII